MKTKLFLITTFVLLTFFAKSQSLQLTSDTNVIFHDFIPDTSLFCNLIQHDSLRIDINQDGVMDFKIFYGPFSDCYPYVGCLNSNTRFYYFNDNDLDSLNNPSIPWIAGVNFWTPTQNQGVKFGVKIISGGKNYYGWIRAMGGPNISGVPLIVDKYAFCKIPNYPFHLGQTEIVTNVSPVIAPDNTNIYVANSGNNLVIHSGKIIKNVTLTSLNGVVVLFVDYINSNESSLSISGIAHGTYIVQVQFSDLSIYTKQIVK
ncbi:MAG: T9SS type A sorting domain-containing protein [Bacteroidota bacterium]